MRWAIATFLLVPLLVPFAGAAPSSFFVNVVDAKSLGCSPDVFTAPDLRVRVYANDAVVLESVQASDQSSPLFAALATVQLAPPVKIGIEIEEAEPSGLSGEKFIQCDAAPGSAVRFEASWNGSATQTFTATGDAQNAATARVVVGYDAPRAPTATVSQVTADGATLAWDAVTTPDVRHRIAGPDGGSALANVALGDSTFRLRDLCDDSDFAVRVIRDAGAWHVGSPEVRFHTLNAAPPTPVVMWAHVVNGTVDVQFAGLPHDAASLEFHEGAGDLVPSNATLVDALTFAPGAPVQSSGSHNVAYRTGATSVVLVVRDQGGLSSRSESVSVAAPPRASGPPAESCTRIALPPPNTKVDVVASPPTTGSGALPGQTPSATTEGSGASGLAGAPSWALLVGGAVAGALVTVGVMTALRKKKDD